MEFEKKKNNHGKIVEFCEKFNKTTSSQKTSCRTLVMEITLLIMENHGKIMEFCF